MSHDLMVDAPEYELWVYAESFDGVPGWSWLLFGEGEDPDDLIAISRHFSGWEYSDVIREAVVRSMNDHDIHASEIATYIHRGDYTPVQRVEP